MPAVATPQLRALQFSVMYRRPIAPEVRLDPRDRHSSDRITIGKALRPPSLHHLSTGRQESAAIKLLVTSVYDTPIDWTTQRTMMRVISFIEHLIQTDVDVADVWRASDIQTSIGIDATN
jgi:hypothetical protein